MGGEHLFVGPREADLPDSRRRLCLLKCQDSRREAQDTPSKCDGARGNQYNVTAQPFEPQHILRQSDQPVPAQIAALAVHQKGGADLDNDTAGGA